MTPEPPQPRDPKKPEDINPDSDFDRAKAYSREFEGKYNRWDCYPDDDDPADFWKKR